MTILETVFFTVAYFAGIVFFASVGIVFLLALIGMLLNLFNSVMK